MHLFIEEECINKLNLANWAKEEVDSSRPDWVKEVAKTIVEWFDHSSHISLHTSGSTGQPKLIKHSKESMRQSAMKTGDYFGLGVRETALLCMPSKFIAGKMMLVRALVLDMDLICVKPSLRPLQDINKAIDFIAMTPMQMESTLDHNDQVALLDKIILGGAPVGEKLQERLQDIDVDCFLTYGMTETITHVAVRRLNGPSTTSVFSALAGVHFEADNGQLVIYADHLDSSPLTTTDQVELIDGFSFVWLGRTDNVINSGGIKIHPEQVESELNEFIDQRFFITGVDDEQLGMRVVLVVEGSPIDEQDLDRIFQNLSNKYWKPREVIFLEEFQMTESGKVLRKI